MSGQTGTMHSDLNLGVIGNCVIGGLVDERARMTWCCMPRLDGDPVFNALLNDADPSDEETHGVYEVQIEGFARSEQRYLKNTAILVTRLEDEKGRALDVIDFAPRFTKFGRGYRPRALVRILRPVRGTPHIRIRLRPSFDYGAVRPTVTQGSNHLRFVGPDLTLRLTTNAPTSFIRSETWFHLEQELAMFIGPDESFTEPVTSACRDMLEATGDYWREWVRHLSVPLEWQEAVIRAAIALKLCWFEETGAIVAAMTTSIPEAAHSGRTWDYRFCWLRDAYYVVQALNRLGAIDIMEGYLAYVRNILGVADGGHIQPVYGIGLERKLLERHIDNLPGYRGMGPVRVGNQAHEHLQHDVYGQVILSAAQAFYDERLLRPVGRGDFDMLEKVGERAFELHDQPDAGLWELRTKNGVHTYSSAMCWAACDRLAKIGEHLQLPDKAKTWRKKADTVREAIMERAWNKEMESFTATFEGNELDASLLQLVEMGFIDATDDKFLSTIKAVEGELLRGNHLMRYKNEDDFGLPENAFNICTFWYIEALSKAGQTEKARETFEAMLTHRNHVGLMSEDYSFQTDELWGNYPQTYSLVGIINTAVLLSQPWSTAR